MSGSWSELGSQVCETERHWVHGTAALSIPVCVILARDRQLFRRQSERKNLYKVSLKLVQHLSRLLSSLHSLTLSAKHAVGRSSGDRSREIECIIKRNECQCITTGLHIRCQLHWQAEFPRFSPRLALSSLTPTLLHSLSLRLSACLTHGGSWGTWRASLVCPGPPNAGNECRKSPLSSPPLISHHPTIIDEVLGISNTNVWK